jgi:sulfide dehydrogenase [flavocytochrome c] flavoprotein subunit
MKRRDFIRYTAIGLGALSLAPTTSLAAVGSRHRVVVVGGGFGGMTAARYLKRLNPAIEVVLIERNEKFISCPISNWVMVGKWPMSGISFSYEGLARQGVKVVQDEIIGLDAAAGYVQGKSGRYAYDRLVVAPGISFRDELIDGYDQRAKDAFPHAWHAGPQTLQLQQQLAALPAGGTVMMTVPASPYRCPPGPYERASLIADYLKSNKPGARLIVVDPHPQIASKTALFQSAWDDYYQDVIDYRTEQTITGVDVDNKSIMTQSGEISADMINLIPGQKAAALAFDLGLVPEDELWAPVKARTLESSKVPGVYVIGDATDARTSGPMPKSGYVANSMGKVVAAAIVAELAGKEAPIPWFANTCYSMVSMSEAIYITGVYQFDEVLDTTITISAGTNVSSGRSALYGRYAEDWGPAIWSDMLGK